MLRTGRHRSSIAALALVLVACSEPVFRHPPAAPHVVVFALSPLEVDVGDPLTLRWEVDDADSVTLDGVATAPVVVERQGMMTFPATSSGSVDLIAIGRGGERRARATYRVRELFAVRIESFTVDPGLVRPGEPVIVTWRTSNATRIRIGTQEGVTIFDGESSRGGEVFRPERSTEVFITAEGFQGPKTASASVIAEPGLPFIHRFEALPAVSNDSRDTTLEWHAERADEVRLVELVASAEIELIRRVASPQPEAFSLPAIPGTRRFRLEAINAAGTTSRSATAVVIGRDRPRILSFTTTPTVTGVGGTVQLDWQVTDAREVRLTNAGLIVGGPHPLVGSVQFDVSLSSVASLRASDDFGERAEAAVDITVDPDRPQIVAFTATPLVAGRGESVELFVETANADSATLTTEDGQTIPMDTAPFSYTPTGTTLLTLTVENAFGRTVGRRRIAVGERPTISNLVPWWPQVRAGRWHRTTWTTTDALRVDYVHRNTIYPLDLQRNAFDSQLVGASMFVDTLRVTGAGGLVTTATVSVEVLPSAARSAVEVEPNDHFAISHTASAFRSEQIDGAVGVGDADHFDVALTAQHRLLAETIPSKQICAGLRVLVYDEGPDGTPLGPRLDLGGVGECPSLDVNRHPALADVGPNILIRIERPIGLAGVEPSPYRLQLRAETRTCSDRIVDAAETCDDGNRLSSDGCSSDCQLEGLDEVEPNDSSFNATPLTIGVMSTGMIAPANSDNWSFFVTPSEAGPFRIEVLPEPSGPCTVDTIVTLVRGGSTLTRSPDDGSGCPTLEGPMTVLSSGTHIIRIDPGRGVIHPKRGTYRVRVTGAP